MADLYQFTTGTPSEIFRLFCKLQCVVHTHTSIWTHGFARGILRYMPPCPSISLEMAAYNVVCTPCVCMHMYMHIYVYLYMHMYMHIHAYLYVCVYVHVHVCVCVCLQVCVYMYTHTNNLHVY